MAESTGIKRSYSSISSEQPFKKRCIRKIQHVQHQPEHVEPAPQDPVFAQGQLLKSIAAGLIGAGFDGVKPSALEMFRSHVDEYMLEFLSNARTAMRSSRRNLPTPQDFAWALAKTPNTSTASLLKPQLSVKTPSDLSYPSIPDPALDPSAPPDLSKVLEPLMTRRPPTYIPRHFPALPSRHTWATTPVYPKRETDARKMRELATQEGMMAEQALRKLAAAEKAGKDKMEKKRAETLSGNGKARTLAPNNTVKLRPKEDTLADLLAMSDHV